MATSRLFRGSVVAATSGAAAFVGSYDTESSVARFARTAWHSSLVLYEYKYGVYTREATGSPERKAALEATHQRAAERLLHVCRVHGGFYTKLGQFVASATHALPPQYTGVLSACQDSAPPIGFEEVREAVERELGCRLEQVYSMFSLQPVAAASLAQVHRATTVDGLAVAVKVQYPKLAQQVASDLRTMHALATLVGLAFEGHSYGWLLPELEKTTSEELDFRHEAANAERTARLFAAEPRLHVPAVLHHLTSARLLTMEFIDGVKVSDVGALEHLGLRPSQLAPLISSVFSAMMFRHGFVHCDPHPGNLLARRMPGGARGAQLVLLDHGMYRELEPSFRDNYSRLWASLLTRDHDTGRSAAAALGVPLDDYDALSLLLTFRSSTSTGVLGAPISAVERKRLREKYGKVAATDVNAFLERLPRDMLFVMRTWALVRSLNRQLGGTSAQRFLIIAEHAAWGLSPLAREGATWRERTSASFRCRFASWRLRWLVLSINYTSKIVLAIAGLRQRVGATLSELRLRLRLCFRVGSPESGTTHAETAGLNKDPALQAISAGELARRLPRELG